MSWMLLMFACESMSNPGNPFTPVAMVSTKQVMGVEVEDGIQAGEAISDEFRDPQEVIEMGENTETVTAASARQVASSTEPISTSGERPLLVDAGQSQQTIVTPEMQQGLGLLPAQTIVTQALESAGAVPVATLGGNSGWPVRLVGTMSDAQPPRAVLGFATGEEVVVTPGMLLPSHQIVVMSIGASQVQLAKIVPMGDRASIQSISLQAAYPE